MDSKPQTTITTGAEDEYTIPVTELFRVVWQRLWAIVLVVLALTGMATGFSLTQTPVYESHTELLVGQEQKSSNAPGTLEGHLVGLQTLAETAVEAVDSRRVAEDVIQKLDLQMTPEALLENLSVEQVDDTQFIQISYMDPDPERAQKIANAIAVASSGQISEVSPSTTISATVWEPATEPDAPIGPEVTRNAVLALLLGLILGVGLAFLLERLDDSWRSPEEVERMSDVPTFGIIPKFEAPKAKKKGGGRE